jgi:PAS domain S-box-containing protein
MKTPIELQSVLETHDKPFLVIDKQYRIVGVNRAFEQAYGVKKDEVIGQPCYQVSHGSDRPCHEQGEECPHQEVYNSGKCQSCLHIHQDREGRVHQVRINVHPLRGADGQLYAGEILDELSVLDQRRMDQVCMVGASRPFLDSLEQLKSAAEYDAPVLLQGETGTGKELAANFIHENSKRREMPFLTLDCTVLTEGLFESEVFGHERGAFTGSVGDKRGLFELADQGTLFLDEIGELSPNTQVKMLRVLESGQFRRVGGRQVHKADARIICATNRNLKEAKWFREDLFYRVACLSIRLPSLKERIEDVPLLARTLLDRVSHSTGRKYQLTTRAMRLLQEYHYPGNVRELRNILWAAATNCGDGRIDREQLESVEPFRSRDSNQSQHHHSPYSDRPIPNNGGAEDHAENGSLADMEAQHIAQLLERLGGNRRRTAEELGISERTLYRKLKQYNLH